MAPDLGLRGVDGMVMDFIGDQDRAKARTWKLIVVFIIAVAAICVAVFAATSILVALATSNTEDGAEIAWNDPIIILGSVGITLTIIVGASIFTLPHGLRPVQGTECNL